MTKKLEVYHYGNEDLAGMPEYVPSSLEAALN